MNINVLITSTKMKLEDAFVSIARFLKSRWSGCILGPVYGVIIYLYIAFLLLKGPPFTERQGASMACFEDNDMSSQNNTGNETIGNDTSTTRRVSTMTTETTTQISTVSANISSVIEQLTNDSLRNPSGFKSQYQPLMTIPTRYTHYLFTEA